MKTIFACESKRQSLSGSWRVALALVFLVQIGLASETNAPDGAVFIPAPSESVEIFSVLPSPSGSKTAYVWSPNPIMLSNYKTFVSVANDDDIHSLLDGILCVAKYRPYMEIRWLDENRIHVDCISQLNDKIYIEGEVSGCTIEYTILAPLSQSEEILVSPERDYVACVIYRKWNNGQKAITDLFFRRISDKSRLFVNLKRNPFNPENDKVLVRFDGIQKLK